MIQQDYRTAVKKTSAGVKVTDFSIETNASMFSMLISKVYNDPILAVVREWSCNACDACIEAGKPVKFDVHLPVMSNPVFYVRDFGTGLSPEDVVGLFSTLGASTKRESELTTGTLGIGRMAGLAVADAFTVESFYKGKRYSYAISIASGEPKTLHMGSNDTTEPDGLKLSVGVSAQDFPYYREKAEKVYQYFTYKPSINIPEIKLDLDRTGPSGDDWFIKKTDTTNNRYHPYRYHSNYVVMAQICYEIPDNSAVQTHGFSNLVMQAKPGAVTFNPGREALSLDKKTIAYLNTNFQRIADNCLTQLTSSMAECENDKALLDFTQTVDKSVPYNLHTKLTPVLFMSPSLQNLVAKNNHSIELGETPKFLADTNDSILLSYKSSWRKTAVKLQDGETVRWATFFEAKHVVVDMKTNFKSGLNRAFCDENVIYWQRTVGSDMDTAVAHAKRYLDAMEISYELASAVIAKQPKEERNKVLRQGFYASYVSHVDYRVGASTALSEEEAKKGTYLYIKLSHTTPILNDKNTTFIEFMQAYKMLAGVQEVPPIRGVAKKYQEYADSLSNWVDFETYIKTHMKKAVFTGANLTIPHAIRRSWSTLGNLVNYPTSLQQYLNNIQDYEKHRKKCSYLGLSALEDLATRMGAVVKEYVPPYTAITTEKVEKRYPLTCKYIMNPRYYYVNDCPEDIQQLAKLEESYAICSAE